MILQDNIICAICGKDIYNRMVYADIPDNPAGCYYAHTSCSKKDTSKIWANCW